ncbi:fructose-6-phosphate aldolase [Symbiobacterium thermophilum]|uniref:Probable transaldolase n=2 Tax=Symbiobacterium thermophilum TaxID=2734 RepID=TAL_SYMTH|nr:fructose-6-phosphate aldolase [Symbiobacterium thermophilum]Q67TE2.1 RecName: Full=Probable transaldolase [Symbiobacterium thermophilum IAM 14863]MBY6275794.1 transaldolase [Symbiobacterium thermophilum]OTA40537.1 MAG: fructose-6-phosphate aldolase [Symbiobacterium thermophilum]BAD39051.1 transaldolase [Symbiobacterium thermophilum IAM 14863]
MKLFIDTANVDDIREVASWGVLSGVTTNPSLVAKEGRDFMQVLREILEIVDGPISAEVISLQADDMVEEARQYYELHKNIVIKLPMTAEGLKACARLSAKGVRCNMTLIFSPNQALLCARAGAAFVSPFVGRLDDISTDGIQLIRDTAEIFDLHGIDTEIIAASIRTPGQVVEAAKAGAHIATIPPKVFHQMLKHPLTDSGIERFLKDWEAAKGRV